ncbi:methyltransferase domain-containing protein [Rhodospirillaceae bacterium KN72]|uniref:Methyltransferase domain-containing protein n=1 Tax=Pacificispira spongiicola TaxID=2729598 RepID=A0A7Y0DYP2_9PROT|nr:methyltransferase domain-containing protein [Pacificispira spongiicola]NMM43231.1 methyltransferase domain-containing protein [Pacificispira spongiicola]
MSDDRLRAARRLDLGLALAEEGDIPAAVEALTAACDLAPAWPEAQFALAGLLERLPDRAEAERRYNAYLALEPDDRMGAQIRLSLLGAAPVPDRLPAAYVEALFDQEAHRFDTKMRDRLAYRGPEVIAESLAEIAPHMPDGARVLDLGCGTGLTGQPLRLLAGSLEGIDLSSKMLVQAAATGLYDTVRQADILTDGWSDNAAHFHLIAAGDVLNYIGDLGPVMQRAAEFLEPGGYFVFTVEAGTDTDIELGEGHRYRHSAERLRPWIAAALLDVVSVNQCVLREEKRRPVNGLVWTLRKPVLDTDMMDVGRAVRGGARDPL